VNLNEDGRDLDEPEGWSERDLDRACGPIRKVSDFNADSPWVRAARKERERIMAELEMCPKCQGYLCRGLGC
jgi:hypothetical protein